MKKPHIWKKKRKNLLFFLVIFVVLIILVSIFMVINKIMAINKKNEIKRSLEFLEAGKIAFANKNYENTIKNLKKSIELNPDNYETYKLLGSSYAILGNNTLAIRLYKKSLSLNINDSDTYRLLGNLFYTLTEYELAIVQFKKTFEINPKDFLALNGLGLSYRQLGNYEESLKYYNQSYNLRANEPAIEGIGVAYSFLGDYDKAIEYLSKVYEKDTYTQYGLFKLAFAYIRKGNYNKAIDLATIQINKNLNDSLNYMMYNVLGAVYAFKKDYKKAIEYYHKSLNERTNTSSSIPTIQLELAYVYLLNNEYEESIYYFEKSVKAIPTTDGYKGLAAAYLFSGDSKKAEDYEKMDFEARRKARRNYIFTSLLATAYLNHENYEKAVKEFNDSINLYPNYYLPYEGLGKTYFKFGDYTKAKTYLEKSLGLNPLSEESKKLLQSIESTKVTIK